MANGFQCINKVITFSESRLMTESISALSQTFITQHGLSDPRLALCPVLSVRDRHIIHGFCHQLLPTLPHSPIYFSLSSQRIFIKRYSVLSLHYCKFSMAFLLTIKSKYLQGFQCPAQPSHLLSPISVIHSALSFGLLSAPQMSSYLSPRS